jgi:4-diphosphocytidyl-2-C-methyl-D-erythritol kinase
MSKLIVTAPAKINLLFDILGLRPDGYHEVKTVMHTLELADTLIISERTRGLQVTCDHPEVPVDEDNLVYSAVQALADCIGKRPAIRVHIRKRIPLAAGMGGGSSDAAAVLLGLATLWKIKDRRKLLTIAARLGSDIPFFLTRGCALGTGRGEKIRTWPAVSGIRIGIVNPGFGVSTTMIYKKFRLGLTRKRACINMMRRAIQQKNIEKIGENLFNALESVTERLFPQVHAMKADLLKCGAGAVLMTGSGPTVYGLLPTPSVAQRVRQKLGNKYPLVLITRTGKG